jgi:hypothetical protein
MHLHLYLIWMILLTTHPTQFALANWTFFDAAILSAHAHPPYEDPQIPPPVHVQFVDWVPGICSLLGMLIINVIDKDRIRGDDYGDSTAVWRARLFLFIGFAFMAGGLAGSVVSLSCVFVAVGWLLIIGFFAVVARAEIYHDGLPGTIHVLRVCERIAERGVDAVGGCALDCAERADGV